MKIYNLFIRYIVITSGISFISCNSSSEKKDHGSNFEQNDNFIEFEKELDNIKDESLPYVFNEKLFKYFFNNASENDIAKILNDSLKIKKYGYSENNKKYPDSLNVKPNSLKFDLYEYFYKQNYGKNKDFDFSISSSKILKSFNLDNKIKLFLASSVVNRIEFLFVSTYKDLKVVDHHVVGIIDGPADIYNKNAIYISKLGNICYVNHSWYESPSGATLGEVEILPNGKFKIINEIEVDSETKDSFHDYQNDFENLKITSITKEEKTELFKSLTNTIPNLTLPYNSQEFYSLMQIDSPEEGKSRVTKLHHNQLQWNENVKYFFSNDPNQIAFKPNKNDYDQDYYFYPVGQFPVDENNIGILYLYQSFCNYHPTVYVQLNTYDTKGNILDAQILDRRFYSGRYRFLSSIEIQENLQIDIKQFIQDYEDEELKTPEIKETSFQITPEGLIK